MRVEGKGLIDRNKPLRFSFDGQTYQGFQGDSLASALLANDVRLMGRSFKYHRPRGVVTNGAEEPNALVTIQRGQALDPNTRATTQPLYEGLTAHSQNAWPSLRWDLLSANDLLSPFLAAGFYYKTFMWPKAFWEKLYEPVIRRAAGLGSLATDYDGEVYEKAFAHCDLLVIGAGPAGLMAALVAGRAGVDVILADEDTRVGGSLLNTDEIVDDRPGVAWVNDVLTELTTLENVRIMNHTTVTGAYDQGTFGALQRHGHITAALPDGVPQETFWRINSQAAILCSGATERQIAFPNNDRPGVMIAGAVQGYLNRYGACAGEEVAIFTNNSSGHQAAIDLIQAGVSVAAVIDSRADAPPSDLFEVIADAQVTGSRGRLGLKEITVSRGGTDSKLDVDCLGVSGGWNPAIHLTCHQNARPIWDDSHACFVSQDHAVDGLVIAGAAAGHFDTARALQSAYTQTRAVVKALGVKAATMKMPSASDTAVKISPLWDVGGKGRAWLDFQNDVTTKDVRQSAQENFKSVEHMKRYTTQGMATDQGKNSNVAALAVLADATGRSIPETGTTTFRPPYVPVALAALGAGGNSKGFAPERFMTSHAATKERGAPFIEAGLWYRPSYFPQAGEATWRESCDREVAMVRETVGICDVSTLGKIDIKGADAARFLDFVYTNSISTLKHGKIRYGLMLREDGFVMDDGTCARLAEEHFLVTTTTAAAGQVMRHFDFVSQCLHPDWDVSYQSVTEHWAQFAVAGPCAEEVLRNTLDDIKALDDLPFMAAVDVQVGGISGRLFRISFSGERGYELAIPARYGDNLFRHLVAQAEAIGGGPYGMEALNVLRIEKGFITHAEIHGRVTAFDIGMQGMISAKKDCVGKVMAARPGLVDPSRQQLVGLKPVGVVKQIVPGAHIFAQGADVTPENDDGYVTSMCFSPTLESVIAQAFVRNGRDRMGEHVQVLDQLSAVNTLCEICDPVFFDPQGGRMRG